MGRHRWKGEDQTKKRPCLKCGKAFETTAWVRICVNCARDNQLVQTCRVYSEKELKGQ